jgi:hypothetical protein
VKQIDFVFLNILIYYLYFSDFILIRYEFAKYLLISKNFIKQRKHFVPKGYLPYATDGWAMATSATSVALTGSTVLTISRDSPPVRQTTTAAMIGDFPGRANKLKRFGRTQEAFWWRHLHEKVTRESSGEPTCGGVFRPTHQLVLQRVPRWPKGLKRCGRSPCT